jgi:hypothetical protein
MLSMEYRGVDRTVWSPYGEQFGEGFGEESNSDNLLIVLNTWSWTERNLKTASCYRGLFTLLVTLIHRAS